MAVSQPPASSGPTPGLLSPRLAIVLPYTDLLINQQTDTRYPITPGFQLGLSMVYGLGPTEPKVLTTDKNGALVVVGGAATTTPVKVQYSDGSFTVPISTSMFGDGIGGAATFIVGTWSLLVDTSNGTASSWRGARAGNVSAQSGQGAGLVAGPGQWSAFANGALGAAASASRAAGGAGVRHIVTGYQVVISSQAAPAVGSVVINIRDGASGAGTILEALSVQIPAALYAPIIIARSGLSLVGSAATAFTIEQSAAYAAVAASINFEGYDVS